MGFVSWDNINSYMGAVTMGDYSVKINPENSELDIKVKREPTIEQVDKVFKELYGSKEDERKEE